MREVWGRVKRLLAADDPETGRLTRALLTVVLAWSLVVAAPDRWAVPVWSALGVSMACWLAFVLLDGRFPAPATPLLALGSAVAATVTGSESAAPTVFLFAMLLLYSAHSTPGMAAICLVTAADVGLMAGSLLWFDRPRTSIVVQGAVMVCTVLFALHRRQYRRALQDRARAMALDERARIARELHDVLAHSLGALGVQLDVAEALLTERGDVAGAVARIRRSRGLAREGLVEARAAVAALREDVPPLPDALGLLVTEHRRDHSVRAELGTTGTRRPLTPAAEVCLLRTAREALTNAAKHAPDQPVTLGLSYGEHSVRLTVRNALPPAREHPAERPTYGLAGMRERVALAGGTLSAGPVGEAWEVRAEVPE
ncbi:sensor histidine kinase [Nonomuraea gerenzanensis]|uniref:histidine kinase n=1 Tax=Nonomuraea gerenzanensis TaxID=93944 RepID=A0A1M4E507_9ACTN|nr:histidine kinase [Nonomuraea gerenzanensis]UBU16116.1 histidine kinase [Nonomuraea gerenzanensis]SBO93921.1 two-component sensor [Nonomuraea gerenzanensis]